MYDPTYKRAMGPSCKYTKKKMEKKEMDEKLMKSIQDMNLSDNYKIKEADSKDLAKNSKTSTGKVMPVYKGNVYGVTVKTTTKKGKKKEELVKLLTE